MEDPLVVAPGVSIPLDEFELSVSRSSGPGGQHANVTASRVVATFDVAASHALTPEQKERVIARAGEVVRAVAQDSRSQARNRELALERIGRKLAGALHVEAPRRPTRPTPSAEERRLSEKRHASRRKQERRRPEPDED
jgi:ribosome-associated protein